MSDSAANAWVTPACLTVCLLLALASHRGPDLNGSGTSTQQTNDALVIPRHDAVAPSDKDGYKVPQPRQGLVVDSQVLRDCSFLLAGHELEQAITSGDSRRLRRQVARLVAGDKIRVVAVGASITSGAGGREWPGTQTNWPGYVTQFADWLRAAFPAANASVHNAGMAGTFSGVFAQCFDTLIPEADVYILEQTTFDGTEPDRCYCKSHYVDTPVQLGIERLIRRMLKQEHQPAVVMVNPYGYRFPNREVYQRSIENQVQVMAQFYGLPMASLRAAAWRNMLSGKNGFDVSTSVKLYGKEELPADNYPLYFDQVHPWGPTGHRMLAELLIRVVQATAAGLDIQPRGQLEAELPREDLVPPMTAGNYETNTSFCWLGDDFHGLIDKAEGFAWINERPEATERKAQKWGFVATEPDSYLEFAIDSRVASSAEDSRNRVVLSYLASYDSSMGIAGVECVAGCQCEATEIDSLWEQQASMLMTAEFAATQHRQCRVRVTVRKKTSGKGHKFKLAGVMVLPAGTHEFSASDRLEVAVPQLFGQG
ncbi:hypothetical protein D9Q98_005936 [Chlorella vulgaris]|uniref:SGNH hydrolase-type esterase domain-containing protein n=1 Tax=Chlorella vulgaris TaxID=3077 RepID=A0A9D4TWS7_CHLVU|nr:hypothetical protein D9Q98_005936 [Chlorella vulgaris]